MKKTRLKPVKLKAKQGLKHTGIQKKVALKKHVTKKQSKIKLVSDSPLKKLVVKTDQIHSMLVRILAADKNGIVKCYTCITTAFWKASGIECGHWQGRSNMGTRYSLLGCKPQCRHCNATLNGNLKVFEENLIKEHGKEVVDMLKQLASKVVRYNIEDLRSIKAELSFMLKNIRKEKGL